MANLLDVAIDTKLKLCALWTSIMLVLIYSDYFGLFTPGTFEAMRAFRANPESRDFMRATFLMKASPILMIFLSAALPSKYNRLLNVVVGMLFVIGFIFSILVGSRLGAAFDVSISISAVRILDITVAAFAALVVWHAWKWPKAQAAV